MLFIYSGSVIFQHTYTHTQDMMPEILKHEAILKYGKLIKKLCCELTENTTEHDEDMILVREML